jgi:TolB protein
MLQLTRQGAICLAPSWGPDAKSLVYTSFHGGFPDVYRIDLRNNRRTRIAGYPGLNAGAKISPDGGCMVLTLSKDGNPELYIMHLRSRRLTRLTRTRRAAEASPAWSPDGKRIVFVSDKSGSPQLYVVARSGGEQRRVTFRGSENVAPDWGPDGRIAYSSRRGGRYHICVLDPSGRAQPEQFTHDSADHEDPAWAPDGRHIVYVRTVRYSSELYVLDTLGDDEIRLTAVQGDWYSPAWSPSTIKRP